MQASMEKKNILKAVLSITLIILGVYFLQTAVFSRMELAGIQPNLLLIITAMFGFMRGKRFGLIIGFFCGILLDVFNGSFFGMYALIYMYIGYLNGMFSTVFYGDDIKLPLILIGFSDLLYGFTIFGTMFLLRHRYSILFYLKSVIMPEAVYTVLISMILFFPIRALNEWILQEDKKGTRDFA